MAKPISLLIVEDDDFLRTLAFNKLVSSGYAVDSAIDGPTGIEKIFSKKYDIIILDLLLPEIDGFQVLKRIRDNNSIPPNRIIVFSNLGSESDISRVLELGVTNYMIKSSFTLDELAEKIKKMLEKPSA